MHYDGTRGWIEVITGSMFSGKTEELLRRLKRAEIARQTVRLYKPLIDTRFSMDSVVSHSMHSRGCQRVADARQILNEVDGCCVVGIDEAQFFKSGLAEVCRILAERSCRVIVAGLDMDFRGVQFGEMPTLLAQAEYVTKVHAVCTECGRPALYSHRISDEESLIVIGEKDRYEPLCRQCMMLKNYWVDSEFAQGKRSVAE